MTKEFRAVLKELVFDEISQVQSHFEKLDPKERIELLIKLLPYVCPKIQSASHSLNEPIDFNFWIILFKETSVSTSEQNRKDQVDLTRRSVGS